MTFGCKRIIVWALVLWPLAAWAAETDKYRIYDLLENEAGTFWSAPPWFVSAAVPLPAPVGAAAVVDTPLQKEISYIQAVALYVARDYENAYKAFKSLFLKEMSNSKINFYLGLCSYELGDYDGAIAAYERVLFVEPGNARCYFELGRSHYALRMYEEAEIAFRKVLIITKDQKLIDAVHKYMANIDLYRQRHFYSGSLTVGGVLDDNVNNGNKCIIPDLGDEPINKKVSDYGYTSSGTFRHRYDTGEKNKFSWLYGGMFYHKRFANEPDYEIFLTQMYGGGEYRSSGVYLNFPLRYEYLYYGGRGYMESLDVMLKLFKPIVGDVTFYGYGMLKRERNLQSENRDNDAATRELSLGVQNLAGAFLPGLNLYLMQRERRKVRGEETAVDSTIRRLKINYQYKINDRYTLYPQYVYRDLKFLDKQAYWFEPEPVERRDRSHNVSINLMIKRSEDTAISVNYAYHDVDSTYRLYSYTKNVLSVLYTWAYE